MTRRLLDEPVAGAGGFELVVGHDLERQVKPLVEFVLPLLDEIAGANDQAAVQIASGHQFLDEQAGHDRFAGARIVGQQKPERLPGEHLAVDGGDLVRERLDERSVDGQQRVEQVCEPDAVGFGEPAGTARRRRRSSTVGLARRFRASARGRGRATRCRAGRPSPCR